MLVLASQPQEDIARLYMNPRADLVYIPLANYLQDLFEVVRPLKDLHSITQPVRVLLSAGAQLSHAVQTQAQLARFADVQTVFFPQPSYPSGWWSATMACKREMAGLFRESDARNRSFETGYYNADMHRAALTAPEFFNKALE